MEDQEKLAELLGRVQALTAVVQLLLMVHPERQKLTTQVDRLIERQEDNALRLAFPDAYGAGLSAVREALQQTDAIAQKSLRRPL